MTTRTIEPARRRRRDASRRCLERYRATTVALAERLPKAARAEDRMAAAGRILRDAMFRRFLASAGLDERSLKHAGKGPAAPEERLAEVQEFLDAFSWRLDCRAGLREDAVSPDILGAAFEQHLYRRSVGAYYTSADVTDYIACITILPALLRDVEAHCPGALPAGTSVRDLVTANVDLRSCVGELVATARDERLPRALVDAAGRLRVIDPMCGTGAFLLAAADVLAEVVEACDRFCLARSKSRGSSRGARCLRCLHGIDLMSDAVEVCRMRLLLWAAANGQVPADDEHNLRVGNALTSECERGTFDVVLGNPPYLEARDVDYTVEGFRTQTTGAVHAWCIERGLDLLKPTGTIGMLVPMALVATQRMKVVQDLVEEGRDIWYANFAWRPARLFEDVNRALTLFVASPSPEPHTFTTGYQRWAAKTRPGLMRRIRYTEAPRERPYAWVPKLSHDLERGLLAKCLAMPTRLGDFLADTDHRVYYRTTGGLYWKVFTDFPPEFSVDGRAGKSSRETWFSLARRKHVLPAIAALSSSTFWWWYTLSSNLRDLNPGDIAGFPLPATVLEDRAIAKLARRYLADLRLHSRPLVRVQAQTGRTETQGFKVQNSKSILDEIDRALAQHYGFKDDEVDLIIRYDVEFRMSDNVKSFAQCELSADSTDCADRTETRVSSAKSV